MTATPPDPRPVGAPDTPAATPWCEVLTPDALATRRLALHAGSDGAVACTLRAPAGAETVQVPIGRDDRLWLRCELPVSADGSVHLTLRPGPDGQWRPGPELPELRLLAPEAAAPPLPLPVPAPDAPWQVALLIDRTTHWFAPEAAAGPRAGLLLADPVRWQPLAGQFRALLSALAGPGGTPVQWALLGFADAPIPEIAASDLQSRAQSEPVTGERRFRPWQPSASDGLDSLTATPGGDWVDALAEALLAAAALPWSASARRLVLVFGDSPGHALLHPLPPLADAQAREHDVDLAAGLLYARGIEVVTLWQQPPAAFSAAVARTARTLIDATGAQYRRLATSPAHARNSEALDPGALAALLRGRRTPLARGVSLGLAEADA